MEYCVLLWVSAVLLTVNGQNDCPELQTSDLGNTDTQSSTGLLFRTLTASLGDASVSVQILESRTVCLGQGASRGLYRTTSLIVRYINGISAVNIVQVDYQCTGGEWGFGSQPSVNTNPTGSFITALRTDCILCFDSALAPATLAVTPDEHCSACDTTDLCVGLGRCTGDISSQICCNYFDMSGNCVVNCPLDSAPNATSFECECDPGYAASGRSCQEINECDSSPCENGGACTDEINAFTCSCAPGFSGDTCTTNIDECDPNPCANGGACTDGTSAFTCACAPGFSGVTCTTDIDECDPNPCANGGTCADTVDAFSCSCIAGYAGQTCTIRVCSGTNPCSNGGTCVSLSPNEGFTCVCVPGFTGTTCEVDVNECEGGPCLNGGTCMDVVGNYMCQCSSFWAGPNCEECITRNCLECEGVNASCINCTIGYIVSPEGECVEDPNFCDPECQEGRCEERRCVCPSQFTGDDCSGLCSFIFPDCFACSSTGGFCVECLDGFVLVNGRCSAPCADVRGCAQCSGNGRICLACREGFVLNTAQNTCDPIQRNRLNDTEIIAIIVGSIVAAILIVAVIACIMSWAYQFGERPRMKRRPKRTVFQDHVEHGNPIFEKPAVDEEGLEKGLNPDELY